MAEEKKTIKKLCLIVTKGTLDMAYPPLMIASVAASLGTEVHIFFTFWGLNILKKGGAESLKISPVGKPEMPKPDFLPFSMPNIASVLPGMTPMATKMMKDKIKKTGMATILELMKAAHEMGVHFHACTPTMNLMECNMENLIPEVEDCMGVAGFLELAADSDLTLFI
ncbi:MAG: DsrE/DsrF/DrsH-like family protein [Candidatus Hydrothermarchaeales archaeon]